MSLYRSGGKRLFDCIASIVLLAAAIPVMGVVAIAVLLVMGWPVFFTQERPGINGRSFRLIKFRSMRPSQRGTAETDGQRLTALGRVLRKTSLDELPELWNVVAGDMSLVGPRPLLMRYLERYSAFQARRHEVRPGITGYAQVHGRNSITWDEKFTLDVWYVDHISFLGDLRILSMTLTRVIFARGISQQGSDTMDEFLGTSGDKVSKS